MSVTSALADQRPPPFSFRVWLTQPLVASFFAGGMAGAVSRTVVSPLERLKILLQIQNPGKSEYKMSVWKGLGKMWREEGFRGFMAGNGTNCIRIVPYSAVQFGSYNVYKPVCSGPSRLRLSVKACGDADKIYSSSRRNQVKILVRYAGSSAEAVPVSHLSPSPIPSTSFALVFQFNQHHFRLCKNKKESSYQECGRH